jgi:deazaflavin-dependent oxidoreductase (nitroreductase family)
MNAGPNAFQRGLHRFFMLRPVTAFFAPWIHRLDLRILKLTKGKYSGSEILGWNIILLTTIGAKTHQPRRMPLLGLFDGEKIALIASSLGRQHNPGWYYNLKAHPECVVEYRGCSMKYSAHEADKEEHEKYWRLALSYYAGYAKYEERARRKIPVIVLEQSND